MFERGTEAGGSFGQGPVERRLDRRRPDDLVEELPAEPVAAPAGQRAGAVGGITAGSVHDLVFDVEARGDHAYRSGVFRWDVEQGMWGILRVAGSQQRSADSASSDYGYIVESS